MLVQCWYKHGYTISTDKTCLNLGVIHQFLTNSYWAKGRTTGEVACSIEHSECFGLYDKDQQIGFARVVTDYVLFAYLLDVFVLPRYRGNGLGKWLVDTIFSMDELKNIKTWQLATKNARRLYEKVGFTSHAHPENLMVRRSSFGAAIQSEK